MRRITYLALGLLIALAIGLWAVGKTKESKPGYVPSSVRLQTMEALTEAYGTYYPGIGKFYQVGHPYREGNVAYFMGDHYYYVMQLEEWRQDANKNFGVTIWLFGQDTTKHWSFTVTPERRMINSSLTGMEMLDIHDAKVIAYSIYTQKLILGSEFDNPRPFTVQKISEILMNNEVVGKREVVEKNDCTRIVEARAYEDGIDTIGLPWYENYLVLADGRRIVDRSIFIKQSGELFCHFWTELVIR